MKKQHKCPKCYKKVGRYRENIYSFKCPECWHVWHMTDQEAGEYYLKDYNEEVEWQRKLGINSNSPF